MTFSGTALAHRALPAYAMSGTAMAYRPVSAYAMPAGGTVGEKTARQCQDQCGTETAYGARRAVLAARW
eukprot:463423-Rhodomonas_salina.2